MDTIHMGQETLNIEQWLDKNEKNKKVLFVEKVREANRLIRRYNKRGKLVNNLTVTGLADVAKEIVLQDLAKQGNVCDFEVLGDDACAVLVERLLKNISEQDNFVPKESISKKTAAEVLRIMNIIRSGASKNDGIDKDGLSSWEQNRYRQLQNMIDLYQRELVKRNVYDTNRLFQRVIDIVDGNPDSPEYFTDTFIGVLMPMELTYLERQFLEKISNHYDVICNEIWDDMSEPDRKYRFFRGYGNVNEIQYVINDILQKKCPFGCVNLFYTSPEQESFIRSAMEQNKISYRMLSGYPAISVKYVYMMKQILLWIKDGQIKSLQQMLKDSGCLRYEDRKNHVAQPEEKCLRIEEEMEKELQEWFDVKKQPEQVCVAEVFRKLVEIQKMYKPKKSLQWTAAKSAYDEELITLLQMEDVQTYQEAAEIILQELNHLRVREEECTDAITVIKADTRYVLEREYNYVIGLSAAYFQKPIQDSPVLTDAGLAAFIDDEKGDVAYTGDLEKNRAARLLDTLNTLQKGEIIIGYSFYDTLNMRECSPSLFYLDLLEQYGNGQEPKDVDKQSFDLISYCKVNKDSLFLKEEEHNTESEKQKMLWEVSADEEMDDEEADDEDEYDEDMDDEDEYDEELDDDSEGWYDEEEYEDFYEEYNEIDVSLSSSAIGTLLHCPLQYYYHYVRYIPEQKDRETDISKWLFPDEKGTLIHSILEKYCNQVFVGKSNIDEAFKENIFESIFNQQIQLMENQHPYQAEAVYQAEVDEIKTGLENYLKQLHKEFSAKENQWQVEACEYHIDTDKKYEIINDDENLVRIGFKGIVDRIDSYMDQQGVKHLRIVDYKSGTSERKAKEIKNNVWIQHAVYGYVLNNEDRNVKVDTFVYEFPFDQTNPRIEISGPSLSSFNAEVEDILWKTLGFSDFSSSNRICYTDKWKKPDLCKYCSYLDICKEGIGNQL